ncbi:glycosyltransferase [Pedobacter sandarakinus]|uniref:glycosyltransferase n=1 Tax=Pedobacter sandarakinus TaxID=353156 RepID=UPI00224652C2|nr:glycosyltransferase [Pedobacter sandarakinus]MCX2574016.1 glycosyltransferase [Pedobacter sandarakinus]
MSDIRICVAISTFNRLELLKECINCLRKQTRKIDQIFVIDNGSTDLSLQWLNEQSDIKVLHEPINIGASAAFSKVIQEGYNNEFHWVWIMDDDAFPREDCLANLIKSPHFTTAMDTALAPVVFENGGIAHGHRGINNLRDKELQLQTPIPYSFYTSENDDIEISFISFVGLLVGKEVIKKIGFPDSRYFIFNDDLEYSIRIGSNGHRLYLNKNAVMFHRFPVSYSNVDINSIYEQLTSSTVHKTLFKKAKDKIAFSQLFDSMAERTIYFYIGRRNLIYTILKYKGWSAQTALYILKNFFDAFIGVIFSKTKKLKLTKVLYHSFKQGITGKFDNKKLLSYKENT